MKYLRGTDVFQTSDLIGSRKLSRYLGFLILGALLCVSSSSSAAKELNSKNVLVLFSFSGQRSDLDLVESSLRKHFSGRVNFYNAYVFGDYEQMSGGASYLDSVAETLRRGYQNVKLDVIIVAAPDALRFATRYRNRIFPGVPIVFYGLSQNELAGVELQPGMTGRTESSDIPATINLALILHPDTQAVAVIEESYGLWWSIAHAELLRHQVKEIDFIGPPSAEEIQRIDALPSHTLVLFQLLPEGSVERPIGTYDVLAEAAKHLPTYSAFHTLCLDYGCIGGVYADWNENMAWAGQTAARILSGEKLRSVPVIEDSRREVMVDWRQLRHWDIAESALPRGSIILYRAPTFWQSYWEYVLAVTALIVTQALLIAGLLWQRARKRKAEAVLRESEQRFRVMADTTPSLVWICDPRGGIVYLSERWIEFTGRGARAGYGDALIEFVHPDDVRNVTDIYMQALNDHRPFSSECRMRRRDGAYRWMFNVASPRVNGDGSFGGFIGSAIDITDQKLAQQALEKVSGQLIEAQEQERSRIARELHHDICQRLTLLSMEIEQANLTSDESPANTKQNLREIGVLCTEIAGDVQSLSHQLHSSILDCLGIATAVRGFCDELSRQYDVSIAFTEQNVSKRLPKDVALCLFRVTQEALHNAVKYSGTTEFTVDISETAEEVRLEVSDAGAGFDVDEAKKNHGLGLVSMQERVHLVHEHFSVESKPGEGTRILVVVPLTLTNPAPGVGEGQIATAIRPA